MRAACPCPRCRPCLPRPCPRRRPQASHRYPRRRLHHHATRPGTAMRGPRCHRRRRRRRRWRLGQGPGLSRAKRPQARWARRAVVRPTKARRSATTWLRHPVCPPVHRSCSWNLYARAGGRFRRRAVAACCPRCRTRPRSSPSWQTRFRKPARPIAERPMPTWAWPLRPPCCWTHCATRVAVGDARPRHGLVRGGGGMRARQTRSIGQTN